MHETILRKTSTKTYDPMWVMHYPPWPYQQSKEMRSALPNGQSTEFLPLVTWTHIFGPRTIALPRLSLISNSDSSQPPQYNSNDDYEQGTSFKHFVNRYSHLMKHTSYGHHTDVQ